MSTLSKARELLAEIDKQIQDTQRGLKSLQSQRKEIAKLVKSLSGGTTSPARARRSTRRGKRTDWNQVIARFKGSFTLDDLSKASGKAKGTVNQAVQIMKKAGKIKPTGKRGEYKRISGAAAPKAKKAAPKPKPKKSTKAKRQSKPKAAAAPQAPQESSSGASA